MSIFQPQPKARPRRSEPYRRWVASLPCALCHKPGPSQAAHADAGKGFGIKAGDDTCYPLCADVPGFLGCHALIGSRARYTKQRRREIEEAAMKEVQRIAKASNQWPWE